MKYYEIELDGETIKFRLTTADCKEIERKHNKSILDFIGDISITTMSELIRYMRRSDVPNFSERDAEALFDKLIDNGYTLKTIYENIIQETLIVSGFLAKTDLQQVKQEKATESNHS